MANKRKRKKVDLAYDEVALKIREQGNLDGFTKAELDMLVYTEVENVQYAIDALGRMKPRDRVVFDMVAEKDVPIYVARAIVDTAISMVSILGPNFQESLLSSLSVQFGQMMEELDRGLAEVAVDDHSNRLKYTRLRNEVVKTMTSILPQTHIIQQSSVELTMSAQDVRDSLIQTYGGPIYDVEPEQTDEPTESEDDGSSSS